MNSRKAAIAVTNIDEKPSVYTSESAIASKAVEGDSTQSQTAYTHQGINTSDKIFANTENRLTRKQRQKEKRKRLRAEQREQRKRASEFEIWRDWNNKKNELTNLVALAEADRHTFGEGELAALIKGVREARERWEAVRAELKSEEVA